MSTRPWQLTSEQHRRMNEFRNHVNVLMGYGIIILLGFAGLMVFLGIAVRAAVWALGVV